MYILTRMPTPSAIWQLFETPGSELSSGYGNIRDDKAKISVIVSLFPWGAAIQAQEKLHFTDFILCHWTSHKKRQIHIQFSL